jgi:hypothetical protein
MRVCLLLFACQAIHTTNPGCHIGNKCLAKIKRRAYSAAVLCIDSVCSVVIQSAADAQQQQQQQQQPHPNNKWWIAAGAIWHQSVCLTGTFFLFSRPTLEEKEDDTKPCSRPQLFPNQSLTSQSIISPFSSSSSFRISTLFFSIFFFYMSWERNSISPRLFRFFCQRYFFFKKKRKRRNDNTTRQLYTFPSLRSRWAFLNIVPALHTFSIDRLLRKMLIPLPKNTQIEK